MAPRYIAVKGVGGLSTLFAVALIAVSALLLQQAVYYQEPHNLSSPYTRSSNLNDYDYGVYRTGGHGHHNDYHDSHSSGFNRLDATHALYHRQEFYRYNPIVVISSIGVVLGTVQLVTSFLLCCVTSRNSRSLSFIWMGGHLLILLAVVVSFALAFYYNVIYRDYRSKDIVEYYYRYYDNPKGQAFSAFLGLDLVFIILALIIVGCLMRHDDTDNDSERHKSKGQGDRWQSTSQQGHLNQGNNYQEGRV